MSAPNRILSLKRLFRPQNVGAIRLVLGGALYSSAILLATKLVPSWGYWYSHDLSYRRQTEAFCALRISLGDSPELIGWDNAWDSNGVQQVWGLGVPLWRMPFEIIAQCSGSRAFPDRIAFGIAIALCSVLAYIAVKLSLPSHRNSVDMSIILLRLLLVATLITPAPIVTLYCTTFNVYEEAVAYSCLYAVALLSLAIIVTLGGHPWLAECTAFVAGLAPLVRPTLVFYAIPTLLAVLITRGEFRSTRRCAVLIGVFACGLSIVLVTNAMRFGAASEFGHKLTLNTYDSMRFTSRFGSPYLDEPIVSAGKELLGLLFAVDSDSLSAGSHSPGMFAGQSTTFRWRELRFTTFDLSNAGVALTAWTLIGGVTLSLAVAKRRIRLNSRSIVVAIMCGWWSLACVIGLLVFYIRFPFVSSRYLLDFSPALSAAATTAALLVSSFARRDAHRRLSRVLVVVLLAMWWCWQISRSAINQSIERTRPLRYTEVLSSLAFQKKPLVKWPDEYMTGMDNSAMGIEYNGSGWDATTGEIKSSVAFFVEDPEFLELTLAPSKNEELSPAEYEVIQAKIGLEFLELESSQPTAIGRQLVFRGPQREIYQSGVQVAFLGLTTREELAVGDPKFRLMRVRWRNKESEAK